MLTANFESKERREDQISNLESLLEEFVNVARNEENPMHLAQALAMSAHHHAENGNFEKALEYFNTLQGVFKGKDRPIHQFLNQHGIMDIFSQSVLWLFLVSKEKEAVDQGLFVVHNHLPLHDPRDVDRIFALLLPTILVLKFVGRGEDAHFIFCKYIVNAYHDCRLSQKHCVELFNPLIYLLEIIKMEECEKYNISLLDAIQEWVFEESNTYYSPDHLHLGHTIMGEICFRLAQLLQQDNPKRPGLFEKARSFLTPIARDVHSEPFLAHTALAYLRAMD
jgi:hypothetical protein